jgi:hypothetical protein
MLPFARLGRQLFAQLNPPKKGIAARTTEVKPAAAFGAKS